MSTFAAAHSTSTADGTPPTPGLLKSPIITPQQGTPVPSLLTTSGLTSSPRTKGNSSPFRPSAIRIADFEGGGGELSPVVASMSDVSGMSGVGDLHGEEGKTESPLRHDGDTGSTARTLNSSASRPGRRPSLESPTLGRMGSGELDPDW